MAELKRIAHPTPKKTSSKKRVRARSMSRRKAADVPMCPIHSEEMVFQPKRLVWACPVDGCKMISHPKDEIGGARPQRIDGPFELVVVYRSDGEPGDVYLRRDKLLIDITEHVVKAVAYDNGATIALNLDDYVRLDHNGQSIPDEDES